MAIDSGVAKARRIGWKAKENGWTPNMTGGLENNVYHVTLVGERNDESFTAHWDNGKLTSATYSIFGEQKKKPTCSKQILELVEGWPDLADLFKWFPKANRPNLVRTYRRLPFDFEDDNEEIISKLLGRKIFWYSHEHSTRHADVVLPKQNNKCRIQDLGHRKLFHFIGAQAGFRSVLLDSLLKVA